MGLGNAVRAGAHLQNPRQETGQRPGMGKEEEGRSRGWGEDQQCRASEVRDSFPILCSLLPLPPVRNWGQGLSPECDYREQQMSLRFWVLRGFDI